MRKSKISVRPGLSPVANVDHDTGVCGGFVGMSGHVTIEDNGNIGGMTGLHQDLHVGKFAFVAGMSRALKDAPPYMVIEGNPCRCYGPNSIALERNNFDKAAQKRADDGKPVEQTYMANIYEEYLEDTFGIPDDSDAFSVAKKHHDDIEDTVGERIDTGFFGNFGGIWVSILTP